MVAAVSPAEHESRLARARRRSAWLFLAPMITVLAAVAAWPLARTIWLGFTDAQLGDPGGARYVGMDNFAFLFEDPVWWRAVGNTLWFTGTSVVMETVLGTVIALVLHTHFPGRGLTRAAVLIPWAIPTVVSAKMWGWMLHDQFGVINHVLLALGIIAQPVAWTAEPDLAMWAVIAVDVWKTTPFVALLVLAALQMLPEECYESARVDGVNPIVVFFRVTLPLIRPALIVAVIFRALDAMRIFDLIYVLTSNSEATMSMSVFARQQLVDFQDVGLGSTASTLLFVIIAALTVLTVMAARLDLGTEPTR